MWPEPGLTERPSVFIDRVFLQQELILEKLQACNQHICYKANSPF